MASTTDIPDLGKTTQGQPVTIHMQFQRQDKVNGTPQNDYMVNDDPAVVGIVYSDDNGNQTRHVYPDVVERVDAGDYQYTFTPAVSGDLRGANYSENFDSREQWVLHVLADPNYP